MGYCVGLLVCHRGSNPRPLAFQAHALTTEPNIQAQISNRHPPLTLMQNAKTAMRHSHVLLAQRAIAGLVAWGRGFDPRPGSFFALVKVPVA